MHQTSTIMLIRFSSILKMLLQLIYGHERQMVLLPTMSTFCIAPVLGINTGSLSLISADIFLSSFK